MYVKQRSKGVEIVLTHSKYAEKYLAMSGMCGAKVNATYAETGVTMNGSMINAKVNVKYVEQGVGIIGVTMVNAKYAEKYVYIVMNMKHGQNAAI